MSATVVVPVRNSIPAPCSHDRENSSIDQAPFSATMAFNQSVNRFGGSSWPPNPV